MRSRIGLTPPLLRVFIWTIPVGAYSLLSLWKSSPPFSYVPDIPLILEAVTYFALGVLLVFRVNRAYERWWEARTLWGTLVNVSRNLAVKIKELVQPGADDCRRARNLIVAFSQGLKDHLRSEVRLNELPGFAHTTERPSHVPSYIVGNIYALMKEWKKDGRVTEQGMWLLDSETRVLLNVCGACERIKNTLPSVSWRFFVRQVIVVSLLIMPWGLVDTFGIWTVPLSMVVCYFIVGGEGIAQFVEEPFGYHEDHLDLDSLCATIDRSVTEILEGVDSSVERT